MKISHLNVEYSSGVIGLPRRFFLKFGDSDECVDLEAWLHDGILAHMDASPTVRCFDAFCDWDTGRAHLIFEDVSHTHCHGKGGIQPSLQPESGRIVDAYAPFHAFWWDHPLLGTECGNFPKEDTILWYRNVASYEKELAEFVDLVGDRLTQQRRALFEKALAS